jgi:hypothetical protein
MLKIALVDEETTGLDFVKDEIWEFAAIIRTYRYNGELLTRRERVWNPAPPDFDPDLFEKTPAGKLTNFRDRKDDIIWSEPYRAAAQIRKELEGAIFVSNNTTFDETHLRNFLRTYGSDADRDKDGALKVPWFYHATDIYSAARGWLSARDIHPPLDAKSEVLSKLCGVDPPEGADRHTALGDARWVERWFDHINLLQDFPADPVNFVADTFAKEALP